MMRNADVERIFFGESIMGVEMGNAKRVFFRDLIMEQVAAALADDDMFIQGITVTRHSSQLRCGL